LHSGQAGNKKKKNNLASWGGGGGVRKIGEAEGDGKMENHRARVLQNYRVYTPIKMEIKSGK